MSNIYTYRRNLSMDYAGLYQKKLTSAEEAVKVVKSGDWVDYGWCTNHPYTLDKALAARQSELKDIKVRGGVTMWMPEICKAEDAGEHFTWHSWHCSGIDRKIITKGMGYFSPMRYSELPRFYRDGNAKVDVAMIQVTPMDKHGNFSYALACSHLADMLDNAKTVIVEVNENLPWVYGLNGCEINIADVTGIINLVMGQDASTVRYKMGRHTVVGNNTYYMELLGEENGIRRYAVNLANSETFANGQLDIRLAPGVNVEKVTLGNRVVDHDLLTNDLGDRCRIVVVSMENAAINSNDGAIVYVEVSGNGKIDVENVIFATQKGVEHLISNASTSGIENVLDGVRDSGKRFINSLGQQFRRAQRGLNIIVHGNGKVTKEIRK